MIIFFSQIKFFYKKFLLFVMNGLNFYLILIFDLQNLTFNAEFDILTIDDSNKEV